MVGGGVGKVGAGKFRVVEDVGNVAGDSGRVEDGERDRSTCSNGLARRRREE